MARLERGAHKQWSDTGKRIPVRSCAICRQRFPQAELLRLTRDSSGLRLDPKRRAAGRGLYVCHKPSCRSEKALMRLSRNDAARLAAELEVWFNHSNEHRIAYEEISPSETASPPSARPS